MAPSRHDWKIVDWDVKPQHNQPTFPWLFTACDLLEIHGLLFAVLLILIDKLQFSLSYIMSKGALFLLNKNVPRH